MRLIHYTKATITTFTFRPRSSADEGRQRDAPQIQNIALEKACNSLLMPKILVKFELNHPNGGAKCRLGKLKSAIFDK